MQYSVHFILALTAASSALAGPLEPRSGLVKRMFWCNGVDSHTICAPGERMVPMEPASCDVLREAGRLNDASPPENGESFYDCGRDDSQSGSDSGTGSDSATSTTASPTSATSETASPTPDTTTTGEEKSAEVQSEDTTTTTGGGDTTADTTTTTTTGTGGSNECSTGNEQQTVKMTCTKVDGVVGQWETLNCTMSS